MEHSVSEISAAAETTFAVGSTCLCPSNWVTRNPWAWISGVRDPVPLSTVGWGSSGPSGDRDRSRTSSTIAQTTGREPVGSATINKSETLIGPGLLFSNFSKSKRAWQYRLIFQLFPLTYAWATSLWRSLNDFGPVQLKFAKEEMTSQNAADFQNPTSELGFNNGSNCWLSCYVSQLHFRKILNTKRPHQNKSLSGNEVP